MYAEFQINMYTTYPITCFSEKMETHVPCQFFSMNSWVALWYLVVIMCFTNSEYNFGNSSLNIKSASISCIYSHGVQQRYIWMTVQRSRATATPKLKFKPQFKKKKTRTDDETWTGKHSALLLRDIVSRLVSIFLTHKENI